MRNDGAGNFMLVMRAPRALVLTSRCVSGTRLERDMPLAIDLFHFAKTIVSMETLSSLLSATVTRLWPK